VQKNNGPNRNNNQPLLILIDRSIVVVNFIPTSGLEIVVHDGIVINNISIRYTLLILLFNVYERRMSVIRSSLFVLLTIVSSISIWEQFTATNTSKRDNFKCRDDDEKRITSKKNRKKKTKKDLSLSSSLSYFEKATTTVYDTILHDKDVATVRKRQPPVQFRLSSWQSQRTDGGLKDNDRVLLAKIYGQAHSVFEYGLGESTYLANYLQVPRYAGIDSSSEWVEMVKKRVSDHFRFYFADVGTTLAWGVPADPNIPKTVWQYQLAPLQSELEPFDVYMVDGRWRTACVLASFLHASARGARHTDTIVLLHDCVQPLHSQGEVLEATRKNYTANDDILELVDHSKSRLCVYKRKTTTTDAMIWARYMKYKNDSN
jgi:hypothetical protein